MDKRLKLACMFETAIAFNVDGHDELIDTPLFKESYEILYNAVVGNSPVVHFLIVNETVPDTSAIKLHAVIVQLPAIRLYPLLPDVITLPLPSIVTPTAPAVPVMLSPLP